MDGTTQQLTGVAMNTDRPGWDARLIFDLNERNVELHFLVKCWDNLEDVGDRRYAGGFQFRLRDVCIIDLIHAESQRFTLKDPS